MREPPVLKSLDETHLEVGGRALVAFVGSDYLRLSWHPAVRQGAAQGIREYGTGACASRMTTGNLPIYGQLEQRLRRFLGVPSATLTSAGYTAPLVAAQALAPEHARVLVDGGGHGCLRDAAMLTGLPVEVFEPGRAEDLARRLGALRRSERALVLVNGIDAVEGRVSPLTDYAAVVAGRGTLLVDDAHGVGVLGERGRGALEWLGIGLCGLVVTFTLSKAFGSYGGVILSDRELRRRILERSRMFTGNTPPPPPSVMASLASLEVMEREGHEIRGRLRRNLEAIPPRFRARGPGGVPGPGPMFAVAASTESGTAKLRRALRRAGIYPSLIAYPNGPAARYFRFALSSAHTLAQVARLAEVLEGWSRQEGRDS